MRANMKKAQAKKDDKRLKSKSKFSNKYSDRIASIRESDKKLKKKGQSTSKNSIIANKVNNMNETENNTETSKTYKQIREEMLKKLHEKF